MLQLLSGVSAERGYQYPQPVAAPAPQPQASAEDYSKPDAVERWCFRTFYILMAAIWIFMPLWAISVFRLMSPAVR